MFWKIIFYIWIFCTIYDIGEIIYLSVRIYKECDMSALPKTTSLYVSLWGWLKVLILCAMPIVHFITCMAYLFDSNACYERLKSETEKKIEEAKEKTK